MSHIARDTHSRLARLLSDLCHPLITKPMNIDRHAHRIFITTKWFPMNATTRSYSQLEKNRVTTVRSAPLSHAFPALLPSCSLRAWMSSSVSPAFFKAAIYLASADLRMQVCESCSKSKGLVSSLSFISLSWWWYSSCCSLTCLLHNRDICTTYFRGIGNTCVVVIIYYSNSVNFMMILIFSELKIGVLATNFN